MVPDIAKAGHSFKGAMAYYLHDKRQDVQEAHPQSADRVAWAEMRNLACLTPETATRVMIATARSSDQLKAEAGVKNTGRKSNAHVYAYSLAWHPDEAAKLDRAEMIRAADQSLKALGAVDHQAVIVCHRDRKHPHVHVIVNRVHPETGVMLSTSNDRRKLSAWANDYERGRGQILTPKREDARQARERAQADFTRAAARPDPRASDPRPKIRPQSEAARLKEISDAQKVQHKQQWADLSARNKAAREKVYADYGALIRQGADDHKRQTKPAWAAFFREARASARGWQKEEQTLSGILRHAIEATPLGQRGSLRAVFRNVLSAPSREAAFHAAQERRRGEFSHLVKASLDARIVTLKEQRGRALAAQRDQFNRDRAALIEQQDAARAKMREAWRQVYERRGKDPRYPARQDAARHQEEKPMKQDFDRSRVPPVAPANHPTSRQSLSHPAPAPAPAGIPQPAPRKVQDVPEVSRTVDAAKPAPTTARPAFDQSAEKAKTMADYWNQKAKERPADRQSERDRSRDFDRER